MVQARDVLKARLFFCRVNVKVNHVGLYLSKKGGGWVSSVWKIALRSVFNRLDQRVFGDPPAVDVNVNVFPVLASDAGVSDNKAE